jgi:hypothetical protein
LINISYAIKGIVSRDWGGLRTVWLDRSKCPNFPFILNFNLVFILKCSKIASIRVGFSHRFLSGSGFSGEHVFIWFLKVLFGTEAEQTFRRLLTCSSENHTRLDRGSSYLYPLRKCRSGEKLLPNSSTTLEQIALWKILLLREIQG